MMTKKDTYNVLALLYGAALYQCVSKSSYQWRMKLAYVTQNWLRTYKTDVAKFTSEVYMQHDRVGQAFEDQMAIIEEIGQLIAECDMASLADTRDFLKSRVTIDAKQ